MVGLFCFFIAVRNVCWEPKYAHDTVSPSVGHKAHGKELFAARVLPRATPNKPFAETKLAFAECIRRSANLDTLGKPMVFRSAYWISTFVRGSSWDDQTMNIWLHGWLQST
jgi:hypothetical protein